MILYLDTSSLVKLYVAEEGSEKVTAEVEEAATVASSVLAYAEARSAFARLHRGGFVTAADLDLLVENFEADWLNLVRLQITENLCREAGELAHRHELRGYDSLHLASYLRLHEHTGVEVRLSAFDEALSAAAAREVQ